MKNVLGRTLDVDYSQQQQDYFYSLESVKAMPTYPHQGYVQSVDGYLVVKLQEQ